MIFTRLTITNLGVYQDRHDFDLRPQQRNGELRPIVLFGGKNGAGKTTILEAIRLCLYGRSALGGRVRRNDYDTYIRQRLHRDAQGLHTQSASVGLVFEHVHAGVRSIYDAVRSWRIEGAAIKENVSIYKDGNLFQEIAPEHWNDFLRDLIPPGLADLFFFDGEHIQALADEEREAETLAAAVRGLLNFDLVERLRSDIAIYLRQQQQQDRTKLQQLYDQADEAYKSLEQELEARRQDLAQLQMRIERTQHKIETARQKLLREGASFIHRRDAIVQRQKEVERALEQTREAMRELAGNLLPFAVSPQWAQRLQARLLHEAHIEREHVVYDAQQNKAAEIALALLNPNFQSATAPSVAIQDWAQIAGAIQSLLLPTKEPQTAEVRHPLSSGDREKLLGWIGAATHQIPEHLHKLGADLERLEAEDNQLELSLKQIPSDDVAVPLLNEFNELAEEKGRLEEQRTRLLEVIRQHEYQQALRMRERSAATQKLAEFGAANDRVQRAAQVQVVLDGYLARITELKITELEQAIAQYFNLLCRKQNLVREVTIDHERFTVTLFTRNRVPLPKSDLSAGEKQLYAIALLWALRSVSGRALPIIVDTPMGRLDSSHREALLTTFFPHAAHQVLLLSTDTEIDPSALKKLEHAVSHTFHLEFDQETGSTRVERGYFDTADEQRLTNDEIEADDQIPSSLLFRPSSSIEATQS